MSIPPAKIYEQQCERFRSLNTIFWQTPLIVTTINGGIWFYLSSAQLTVLARSLVLFFAFLVNIAFICALIRLRILINALLSRIRAAEGDVITRTSWITVTLFSLVLGAAALGALAGSLNPSALFQTRTVSAQEHPKPLVTTPASEGRGQPK
jgi:hypothetical protein